MASLEFLKAHINDLVLCISLDSELYCTVHLFLLNFYNVLAPHQFILSSIHILYSQYGSVHYKIGSQLDLASALRSLVQGENILTPKVSITGFLLRWRCGKSSMILTRVQKSKTYCTVHRHSQPRSQSTR